MSEWKDTNFMHFNSSKPEQIGTYPALHPEITADEIRGLAFPYLSIEQIVGPQRQSPQAQTEPSFRLIAVRRFLSLVRSLDARLSRLERSLELRS